MDVFAHAKGDLMRAVMSTAAAALTASAMLLAISGCRLTDDPAGRAGEKNSGAAHGADGRTPSAAPPSRSGAPEGGLATRDASDNGNQVRIALTSLAREGELATLNFRATALSTRHTAWQVGGFFGDLKGSGGSSLAANGLYLIDTKNKKKHLVAADAGGGCVCSTNLSATFVRAGQSVVLSATFAAPPPDVTAVDVFVPNVGTFRNVPIS